MYRALDVARYSCQAERPIPFFLLIVFAALVLAGAVVPDIPGIITADGGESPLWEPPGGARPWSALSGVLSLFGAIIAFSFKDGIHVLWQQAIWPKTIRLAAVARSAVDELSKKNLVTEKVADLLNDEIGGYSETQARTRKMSRHDFDHQLAPALATIVSEA